MKKSFVCLMTIFFCSCATIFEGTRQKVNVDTKPSGADLYVDGYKYEVKTPCTIYMYRDKKYNNEYAYNFTFKKYSFKDKEVVQKARINPLSIGGFFVFGLFNLWDWKTGAAHKYPSNLMFYLESMDVKDWILQEPEYENDRELRRKTVEEISDQNLLFEIALTAKDWQINAAAIERLTDQNHLFEIALTAKDWQIFTAAVKRLSDQNLLIKLAFESEESKLRVLAVNKIDDQNMLFKLVLDDKNYDVKKEAFNKIADQNLINRIAFESKENDLRKLAVSKIIDQEILRKIFLEDGSYNVKKEALNKIEDQNIIVKLALESEESGLRKLAISRVTDQNILYKIALEDSDLSNKYSAMSRLTPGILTKLANVYKEPKLRLVVVELQTDQNELLSISQNNKVWEVRKAAYIKLNDNSLDILSREAKDPVLSLSAKISLGRISWDEAFKDKSSSSKKLGQIIGAIAMVDSSKPSSDDVIALCQKYIRIGDSSRIPELIYLLNNFGDVTLAEDYMNCGQSTLADAGCQWGRANGYQCTIGAGSTRVRWGSNH